MKLFALPTPLPTTAGGAQRGRGAYTRRVPEIFVAGTVSTVRPPPTTTTTSTVTITATSAPPPLRPCSYRPGVLPDYRSTTISSARAAKTWPASKPCPLQVQNRSASKRPNDTAAAANDHSSLLLPACSPPVPLLNVARSLTCCACPKPGDAPAGTRTHMNF